MLLTEAFGFFTESFCLYIMRFINRYNEIPDWNVVTDISRATGCSLTMSELLYRRGIFTREAYSDYINCSDQIKDDPFLLPNMQAAVNTIKKAIKEKISICVYGDYDVDGICATTILFKTLRRFTDQVSWYIPSRKTEGYGMHEASVQKLAERGVSLIITVDNGISAYEEANLVYALGMKLIITDHHRFSGVLPKAEAIVASSLNQYNIQVNDLSGAGVAWMLARAITGSELMEFLPYVALAIAADSVQVTRDNRKYLKTAFPLFLNDPHFSILLKNAGSDIQDISMHTLNFIFAPRINASGRMAHAEIALRYFLSDNISEMTALAKELEMLNQERKIEESRIFTECITQTVNDSEVLVFYGEDWNTGVVGIVASRLVEVYHKNVFVLGKAPSGEYVGSGRSDGYTDLYALILPCASVLERFGGHAGAAGVSVSPSNLASFCRELDKTYRNMFPGGAPVIKTEYDMELRTEECNPFLAKEIKALEPFGHGNPEPVFRIPFASIKNVALMGKNLEHLSASCNSSNGQCLTNDLRIVGFGFGNAYDVWNSCQRLDILVTITLNRFRNVENCEGRLISYNSGLLSSEPVIFSDLVNAFFEDLQYNDKRSILSADKICLHLGYPYLSEERLRQLFLLLFRRYESKSALQPAYSQGTVEEIAALLIFKELGFVSIDKQAISFLPQINKRNCHDSLLFTQLNPL